MRIGTAGWSIPREHAAHFPDAGSGLERYASRFNCVEINSSFYRSHRPATWARWAASVPKDFRFAVKIPKQISHERRLVDCADILARFLDEVSGLDAKLAVLLLQLPPKFEYEAAHLEAFVAALRAGSQASLVCEPRHPSWFEPNVEHMLEELGVARVAADPARVPTAATPGGWRGITYRRLHGSPQIYRSSYGDGRLEDLEVAINANDATAWCIFDNTASGAAVGDALDLQARLTRHARAVQ